MQPILVIVKHEENSTTKAIQKLNLVRVFLLTVTAAVSVISIAKKVTKLNKDNNVVEENDESKGE